MNFSVDRVGGESQQIANNLFQLYSHDFSEFAPPDDERFNVDDDGLFGLPLIEKYWTQPNHSFHLFRANGKLAGFAAINDWSPSGRGVDHNIAEFFVMRHFRRNGAGTQLARELFLAHPGFWELAIMASNKPAQVLLAKSHCRHAPFELRADRGRRLPLAWGRFIDSKSADNQDSHSARLRDQNAPLL